MRFKFYHVSDNLNSGIEFHDAQTGDMLCVMNFTEDERIGHAYIKEVDLDSERLVGHDISYLYLDAGKSVTPSRAFAYKTPDYGKFDGFEPVQGIIPTGAFNWSGDVKPKRALCDSFMYCCHVRGFTAHASSGVKHKGTFLGVSEKADYLQELGVTALEFQPVYEFAEVEYRSPILGHIAEPIPGVLSKGEGYINYWGYKSGYYYAPKMSYSNGDPINEFKQMVKKLHSNGIEVILQIYWPKEQLKLELLNVLRFWVLEYHVDGFHLLGDDIPVNDLAKDACLSDTKLFYYGFDIDGIYGNTLPKKPVLATYRDDYLYVLRKFLKSDEGMVPQVLGFMRNVPVGQGIINYITNYYGFTMKDLVSFDQKHNEANGEGNRDGNEYNCSWNCGAEGPTRKKKIKDLRMQQYKNALTLLILSQGTPLIFMGDEFGNTQNGNNNPYNQDNEITWLDWKALKQNKEIAYFLRNLLQLRNSFGLLHPERELRMMDVDGCGYPDLSYHGEQAWRTQTDSYSRCFGQMYCSKEKSLYVAVNMHWEQHSFGLPKLGRNSQWKYILGSSPSTVSDIENDTVTIGDRSIAIFEACKL